MAPARLPLGPRLPSPLPPPRAFTLVEMLVVLGIIGLLMSMLLPAITGARRSAQLTKCANNLRQIGMAMSQYLTDYDQTLPGGRASNSQDDPGPPRDSPDPWGLDIYAIVGDQLDKYLRHDLRIWHCPAARVVTMDIDTVHASLIEEDGGHPGDATTGDVFGPAGRWRPGYFYMSMRSWEFNNTPTWRGLGMWRDDWMARNIGGLKVNELNTLGAQAPSEIVLFVDYSSKFHSYKAADELDDVPQTAKQLDGASPAVINREKFQSNFLYLDGHVETKRYDWVGGLLNVLHRPIKQSWGGKDWFYEHKPGYRHHYPD